MTLHRDDLDRVGETLLSLVNLSVQAVFRHFEGVVWRHAELLRALTWEILLHALVVEVNLGGLAVHQLNLRHVLIAQHLGELRHCGLLGRAGAAKHYRPDEKRYQDDVNPIKTYLILRLFFVLLGEWILFLLHLNLLTLLF